MYTDIEPHEAKENKEKLETFMPHKRLSGIIVKRLKESDEQDERHER